MAFLFRKKDKKKSVRPSPEGKEIKTEEAAEAVPTGGAEVKLTEGTEVRPIKDTDTRPSEGSELKISEGGSELKISEGTQIRQSKACNVTKQDNRLPSLSKGLRKFTIVTVPSKCDCGWTSRQTEDLYLGEANGCHVHVVSKDGNQLRSLSFGPDYIHICSGIEIADDHHLVTWFNGENKTFELWSIKIELNEIISKDKIATNWPKSVFQYDNKHIGVFCLNPVRIELYGKSDLKLYKTVLFDIEVSSNTSKLDVCKAGECFCLSDCDAGVIYMLNVTGDLVQTLGGKTETASLKIPGKMNLPVKVLPTAGGGLVIVCADGSFHRYACSKWELVVKSKGEQDWITCCVATDSRVYTIYEDQLSMYKIRE